MPHVSIFKGGGGDGDGGDGEPKQRAMPIPQSCRRALSSATAATTPPRREPRALSRTTSINSGSTLVEDASSAAKKPVKELIKSMVGGNVHSSYNAQRERETWMKKPLFNREGESSFSSGADAALRLQQEAIRKDPYQFDLHESIHDITQSIVPLFEKQPRFAWVMKQLMEPERTIMFRVKWVDDDNNMRINRGYRVQYSSAMGPFRGGLRFSSSMNYGQMRMHGFEKTLKSALAGEPWGGASGGADLDVRGKSPEEMRRFCMAFMQALGPFLQAGGDLLEPGPAVGAKEMDVMLAAYRKHIDPAAKEATLFAPEAFRKQADTGRGAALVAGHAMERISKKSVKGLRCALTGSDARSLALARALIELGAAPVSFTDATGALVQPRGFDASDVDALEALLQARGRLSEFHHVSSAAAFHDASTGPVWAHVKGSAELAFPTQSTNEVNADDAAMLVEGGCRGVFEVADRACSTNAVGVLESHKAVFAPSKLVSAVGADQDLNAHFAALLDAVQVASVGVGCDPSNLKVGASVLAFSRVASSRMYA